MPSGPSSLPLPVSRALRSLGRDLAVARKKRRISAAEMAERLFISRDTLWRLEKGDPTVAIGTLATALFVLQLHDRLASLAAASGDALGLEKEAELLPKRIRRAKS
ncbi:MAG: helix-turn-helix transcriptional regulator [Verrucomicrobiaceae bacterium]|jgi:transcriptional regulator with XRE-family HTH domain|nr:helix-turn-helix transcriptional regulator [Verrucomicrobiaceae bacterium]